MMPQPPARVSPLTGRIGTRYLLAFAVLSLVVHEAHEMAHTWTGRMICGAWGPRDFNVWSLPDGCTTLLATAAGPALSYALMLGGAWLMLRGRDERARRLGLAVALATNPLARVITAAMGGGDEGVLARAALDVPRGSAATAAALAVVLPFVAVAVAAAWRTLGAGRRSWLAALLVMPMLTTGVLLFAGMNRLLARGVLASPTIGGAPALVQLATLASVVALALCARWLVAPADRAPTAGTVPLRP
jgi:hypothetical protein